ncbi:MAG TPA: asparaginase [Candidatus Limnocylindrales bacterium]|nr:asparaginase [Candidatus Limnocylindrales bacterium]
MATTGTTGSSTAAPTSRRVSRGKRYPRYPRSAPPPVLAEARRGDIVESRHRGHVVQVAADGRIERAIGDPDVVVSLRSAVKPFALVALLEAGADQGLKLSASELAVMAASHNGEDAHVRTLQGVFRRAGLSQSLLANGAEAAPLDELTAARLARQGESPSPIRHMCSGFHAASLLLSRHAGWSLADYWQPDHPSQRAVADVVARVFDTPPDRLSSAIDACGVPTYAFPLADVARAFALLADPGSATDGPRRALAPHLQRVRDSMLAAPEMIGGSRDSGDTMLMKARPGLLVSKSGAEALRGVGLLPGARGEGSPAAGLALKIEDGDGRGRASRSVTIEALAQLRVLDGAALERLADMHRPAMRDPRGTEVGRTVASFELAPIGELL